MTARTVRWTQRAVNRLDGIGVYIETQNPTAAGRVISRIISAVNTLAEQPYLGRPGRITGTRELVLTDISYIIPYRITAETVDILTVMHATQKWPNSF